MKKRSEDKFGLTRGMSAGHSQPCKARVSAWIRLQREGQIRHSRRPLAACKSAESTSHIMLSHARLMSEHGSAEVYSFALA